jgi:hypothetical protein
MPTFDTPAPISVSLEIGAGDIRITASERADTTVEVRPSNPSKSGDVTAAEQTRVDFAGGRLVIKGPKRRLHSILGAGSDSIDIELALPAGSDLHTQAGLAAVQCTGALGECRLETGFGDVAVGDTRTLSVKTGGGQVSAQHVGGDLRVVTGTGAVQVGAVDGAAVVKSANGDTTLGDIAGDLRVSTANGRIAIGTVGGSAVVKTASGDIELAEVVRGSVVVSTAYGKVAIGVRDGVPAWLDLNTGFGHVVSELDASGAPEPGADSVEVKARSGFGDITIRRAVMAT